MFDIGFSELMVVGLVALIVIGPERLPRVARTVGHLIGRLQRYVADVKSDISREVELDEFRKMRDSVQEAASGIETSVTSGLAKTEDELNRSFGVDTPVVETGAEAPALADPPTDAWAEASADAPAEVPAKAPAGTPVDAPAKAPAESPEEAQAPAAAATAQALPGSVESKP